MSGMQSHTLRAPARYHKWRSVKHMHMRCFFNEPVNPRVSEIYAGLHDQSHHDNQPFKLPSTNQRQSPITSNVRAKLDSRLPSIEIG